MKKIGNLYFHGKRDKKEIALTFDDGPSKETLEILKILKKYDAKATFFVEGKRIENHKSILEKTIKEGHEIGNHSYNHYRLWFKDKKLIEYEIKKTDNELNKYDVKTNLFRPPGFKIGFNLLNVCKKLNKKIIICDVSSDDWKKPGIEKIVNKVLKNTQSGSIINFHDYLEEIGSNKEIISALQKIIPKLKKKYEFVTISKLLKLNSS